MLYEVITVGERLDIALVPREIERALGARLLAPEAAETARRAALLAKADLCTFVVGEFPDRNNFV